MNAQNRPGRKPWPSRKDVQIVLPVRMFEELEKVRGFNPRSPWIADRVLAATRSGLEIPPAPLRRADEKRRIVVCLPGALRDAVRVRCEDLGIGRSADYIRRVIALYISLEKLGCPPPA